MRKPVLKLFWLLFCVCSLWGCGERQGGKTPENQTQEMLSYEIGDAEVTITHCNESADGDLEIPAEIAELPVTSIGKAAFFECTGLTSIAIPDSVTSIGTGAFAGCISLNLVTIPGSVTSIGERSFLVCPRLTSIAVALGNSSFKSLDGVVFSNDETELLIYPAGKSGDYGIPDSVTSIGSYAFFGCRSLTSVTIPDSVSIIGRRSFFDCFSLTSVTIPESVTNIGDSAFNSCKSLTSITIPQAFHSEAEVKRLGLDKLWPDGFALPDSSSK